MKRKIENKNSKKFNSNKKYLETSMRSNLTLEQNQDQLIGKTVDLFVKLNFPNRKDYVRENFLHSLDSIIKTVRSTILIKNNLSEYSMSLEEMDSFRKNQKSLSINTTHELDKVISEIQSCGNDWIDELKKENFDWIKSARKLLQLLYSLKQQFFNPKKCTMKELQESIKSTGYKISYPRIDWESKHVVHRPDGTGYIIKFNKNIVTKWYLKHLIQQIGIQNLESIKINPSVIKIELD